MTITVDKANVSQISIIGIDRLKMRDLGLVLLRRGLLDLLLEYFIYVEFEASRRLATAHWALNFRLEDGSDTVETERVLAG